MSQLMPERRPDKHGNLVTRWIRKFTHRSSPVEIPAPVAAPLPVQKKRDNQKEINELCDLLVAASPTGTTHNASKVEIIADRDPDTLRRITEQVRSNEQYANFWAERCAGTRSIFKYSDAGQERFVRESRWALAMNPLMSDIANSGGDIDADAHRLLNAVAGILEGEFDEPSEDLILGVTVIAYVRGNHTDAPLNNSRPSYDSIEDDVFFIVENFDQIEPLIHEMRTRRAHDRETIEALLSAPSSLAEGAL